jgi:hypothetical protein
MKITTYSPRITHISWGKIEVDGQQHFKDAKCFPGGSRTWDWKETGTQHSPGIQPADIQELLEKGITCLILSKGMLERLQVCPETLQLLKNLDISVHVRQTKEAVELYNKLRETFASIAVGGLFHSTC